MNVDGQNESPPANTSINRYESLPQQEFIDGERRLIPIREVDIMNIRRWRNEQLSVLRQATPITEEQQHAYYRNHIEPLFSEQNPSQILFSYLRSGCCIGYGGLVHISWQDRRAELSFLLDTAIAQNQKRSETEFRSFLNLIEKPATALNLHRLFTETYAYRTEQIRILESKHFSLEGRMRDHVFKNGRFYDSLIHGKIIAAPQPPPPESSHSRM